VYMLWLIVDEVGRFVGRPLQWRAPTWSWASVEATIGYWHGCKVLETHASLMNEECVPVGVDGDASGVLKSAQMRLSCSPMPAKLLYVYGDQDSVALYHFYMNGRCTPIYADYALGASGPHHVEHEERISCVTIVTYEFWESAVREPFCLALRSVKSLPATYERIGLVIHKQDDDIFEHAKNVSEDVELQTITAF
jgi:hypothetical protein